MQKYKVHLVEPLSVFQVMKKTYVKQLFLKMQKYEAFAYFSLRACNHVQRRVCTGESPLSRGVQTSSGQRM